ncbi:MULTISPECIES: phage tail protein [unclassified Paraburkholderia]|uniref:phage tail protein n=1 Tax=unclassified Paraburkholderia TaxID=2615204 RepID=UPI001622ECB1|nr:MULTISPECIES: phage tail protein [unclassified Paraburkholderia]MBB5447079.1 microcystin-dependent protein [Paraburkholderia sp. WSM4177]MBB5487620.1 microcystin-dependent protein [Paraburkholderia sp. WSM4180]
MDETGIPFRITDAGRAAFVSLGNTGTNKREVVEIGVGVQPFEFAPDMTVMPGEYKRISTFGGQNVAPDQIHVTMLDTDRDQYTMYAFALYLDTGELFGLYVQDTPITEKSPQAKMLLSADVKFASFDASQLVLGDTMFLNPPATTDVLGVVRLATQAEVDAGTDDRSVLTPKTAGTLYAKRTGDDFSGRVRINTVPTLTDAQLELRGTSGGLGREAKLRFRPTFGTGTDTGAWLAASIRSGFDGGTWGKEYLDFYVNSVANSAGSDANQVRAMRITYGGRVLIGVRDDDGKKRLQVAGDSVFDGNVSMTGAKTFQNEYRMGIARDDPTYQPHFVFANSTVLVADPPAVQRTVGSIFFRWGSTTSDALAGQAAAEINGHINPDGSSTLSWITRNGEAGIVGRMYLSGKGNAIVGTGVDDGENRLQVSGSGAFSGYITARTPLVGDVSTKLVTTEFLNSAISAISSATIGQIVFEPRTAARAGYLKANGALLNRADYPVLWAYAQASGALVDDGQWGAGNWGCFSTGNGATTFRIPELRGEGIRCWDDGRGIDAGRAIGSWQDSQNRSHTHAASTAAEGSHDHLGWTDAQGLHSHGGYTLAEGQHQHVVPWGENYSGFPWGTYGSSQIGSSQHDNDNFWMLTSPEGLHQHQLYADGNHAHAVGVAANGSHSHAVTINADGGTETRVRSVALLAMIRAY